MKSSPVYKIETTPSSGKIKCWMSPQLDAPPQKYPIEQPPGYCYRGVAVGSKTAYYGSSNSSDLYSKPSNGIYPYQEFYSCNTDYCNDPSLDYKSLQKPVYFPSENNQNSSTSFKVSLIAFLLPLLLFLF